LPCRINLFVARSKIPAAFGRRITTIHPAHERAERDRPELSAVAAQLRVVTEEIDEARGDGRAFDKRSLAGQKGDPLHEIPVRRLGLARHHELAPGGGTLAVRPRVDIEAVAGENGRRHRPVGDTEASPKEPAEEPRPPSRP
jgi:hypothetical protein